MKNLASDHINGFRAAREAQGLTREVVAVRAGIASRTLARIEAGENANVSTLQAVAAVLDIPLGELLVPAS